MTILDSILVDVRNELAEAKAASPLDDLERRVKDMPPARDFHGALCRGFGLIAEIKQRSPSVGPMIPENVGNAPRAYEESAAVRAISVLTNRTHFGMDVRRLEQIRQAVSKPILRKDFIIDEYQIFEARAFGADAILLMANVLDASLLDAFYATARGLGMEALFEIHAPEEIASLPPLARIAGINSRKFKAAAGFSGAFGRSEKDFSLEYSAFDLVDRLPPQCVRVAESGLSPENVLSVRERFDAALVGTSLLRAPEGVCACLAKFEKELHV